MKLWKQAACISLAAALLLTAGCAANDKAWAYRTADVEPPVGVYIFNMMESVAEAETKLREANADNEEYALPEKYSDLLKATVENGQTVDAYLREEALRKTKEYIAVEQKFAELGLSLDEAQLAQAQTSAENAWSGDASFENNGVAENSLRLIIENSFKNTALFDATFGPEGTDPVSETELKDQFQKQYVKMEYLMAAKDMAEGADNSALKTTMESYRDRVAEGDDFYEIIREHEQAEADKNAAEGEEPAQISKPEPGTRSMILNEGYRSYYGDELVDGALNAKVGEPIVIEDEYTYYLIRRQDIMEDPADFEGYREELLQSLKGEEYKQLIADWAAALPLESNQPAVDKYTPSRLTVNA